MSSTSEPTEKQVYRLVVAEDAYLVREGIRETLQEGGEIEVAAVGSDQTALPNAIGPRTAGGRADRGPHAARAGRRSGG